MASDETRDTAAKEPDAPRTASAIVTERRVLSHSITPQEQAERVGRGPEVSETHPNAPKPKATLKLAAAVVQLRRQHASNQPKKKPSGMSDIKI